MTDTDVNSPNTRESQNVEDGEVELYSHQLYNHKAQKSSRDPNIFVRVLRALFGYRKTSLTFLVFLTVVFTVLLSIYDNSLELSVKLPTDKFEQQVLDELWDALQVISRHEHTYASHANDKVHDYLENIIGFLSDKKEYIEYDNDLNNTHSFLRQTADSSVTYYESNNLIVRINGSNSELPALLLSAHYDSVPSSFGVTDDGMGIASLVGILLYYADKKAARPERTIIINFNNNEEFGLYGALAFLSHPWFKQIGYFLNLEGTGAGGKAVLFRGTDYGIVKHFNSVRYPYANSLFQQAFSGRLVHSETDYKYYAELGHLQGLDLAFYKPRDKYHTGKDNIANVNKKSLWHMLSNAIDFTSEIVAGEIDLDVDKKLKEAAAYGSLFNFFFALPMTRVLAINILLMVLVPLVSLIMLIMILVHRKWSVSLVTFLKFPVSLTLSLFLLDNFSSWFVVPHNNFLPNSSAGLIAVTYFTVFILLNYLFLNGINLLFHRFKGSHHDEKLVVILQICFLYWITLIWSTANIGRLNLNAEHSGEFLLSVLYILQALGSIFGLFCWLIKKPRKTPSTRQELEPLLENGTSEASYGTEDNNHGHSLTSSSSVVLAHLVEDLPSTKHYSYDWSLQFLLIVPLSSFLLYNYGWLVLEGLKKTLQESAASEGSVFKALKLLAVLVAVPYLPFIFKINRVILLVTVLTFVYGFGAIIVSEPFTEANPLKLRFLQTIDLSRNSKANLVSTYGRSGSPLASILEDLPSVKESGGGVKCETVPDGMEICRYEGLLPHLVPGLKHTKDLLRVKVLQNSSSSTNYPFGILDADFEITAKENRECRLSFKEATGSKRLSKVVKSVVIYNKHHNSTSNVNMRKVPEGFSKDDDGNFIYKNMTGISELNLNKLDWNRLYRIGLQWVANLDDSDTDPTLGVSVDCYWAELDQLFDNGKVIDRIPAYSELLQYSPNYVTWSNREQGVVNVKTNEIV